MGMWNSKVELSSLNSNRNKYIGSVKDVDKDVHSLNSGNYPNTYQQ